MSKTTLLQRLLPLANSIKTTYGSQFLKNPKIITQIFDKLKLESQYKSKELQVVDIYSGPAVQSAMLTERLHPKKCVLFDDRRKFAELYQQVLDGNGPIVHYNKNPYKWESFLELTEQDKILTPSFQARDHIHDEFLVTANLTNKKGEQLYVQYLQCVANQNWLQRFGLVKMLVWIPSQTAKKLFAPFSNKDRNRITLLSEMASNTKLITTSEASLKYFLPESLSKFDPVIIPSKEPHTEDLSLVEINPRNHNLDLDNWDYVTQKLMILKSQPIGDSIEVLGHGAKDWFSPRLRPELLKKKPYEMTYMEINEIAECFALWPFKPHILIDFYDDDSA